MSFKHLPVYNQSENFSSIINHSAIKYFLTECGGYIAGGLAEKEFVEREKGDDKVRH